MIVKVVLKILITPPIMAEGLVIPEAVLVVVHSSSVRDEIVTEHSESTVISYTMILTHYSPTPLSES